MKFPKWQEGRQGTGYKVLTLINNKFLKFDCHILQYVHGSLIPSHRDPVKEGYKHYRLNIVLRKSDGGGVFVSDSVIFKLGRIVLFRPDISTHQVTTVIGKTRYVLSIGWLKKVR